MTVKTLGKPKVLEGREEGRGALQAGKAEPTAEGWPSLAAEPGRLQAGNRALGRFAWVGTETLGGEGRIPSLQTNRLVFQAPVTHSDVQEDVSQD